MITLRGKYGLGFDNQNKPVDFTHLWRDDVLHTTLASMGSELNASPQTMEVARTVSYVNIWARNYFHFVTECLASLVMMNRHTFDQILVIQDLTTYMVEGLQALGLYAKVKYWSGVPTAFKELIPPEQVRHLGYSRRESLDLLKDWLNGNTGAVRRVYISREDAYTRCVQNEVVPPKYLRTLCSELTFMDQVSLFSGVEVIAGPHGAGLTNMIWARKGCHVIEFFGTYENDCYEKLAKTLGHHYTKVNCPERQGKIILPDGVL